MSVRLPTSSEGSRHTSAALRLRGVACPTPYVGPRQLSQGCRVCWAAPAQPALLPIGSPAWGALTSALTLAAHRQSCMCLLGLETPACAYWASKHPHVLTRPRNTRSPTSQVPAGPDLTRPCLFSPRKASKHLVTRPTRPVSRAMDYVPHPSPVTRKAVSSQGLAVSRR